MRNRIEERTKQQGGRLSRCGPHMPSFARPLSSMILMRSTFVALLKGKGCTFKHIVFIYIDISLRNILYIHISHRLCMRPKATVSKKIKQEV